MHLPFNLVSILKSDTARKYVYVLAILSVVVCAGASSESIFSSKGSGGSSFNSAPPSNLTQEEGFHCVDNSAVESFRVTGHKVSRGLLSIVNTASLNSCVSSLSGILSDTGTFSPYISIYSFLPLRSPPYFLYA